MARVKSKWICQQCGYETAGYLGKCPECGSTEFIEITDDDENEEEQKETND